MTIHSSRPERRRMERIRFRDALVARFGTSTVLVVDLTPIGAGIEHFSPLKRNVEKELRLAWRDETIGIPCRVATSHVHRFAPGDDGITVYRSGLQFLIGEGIEIEHVRGILTETLECAFLEQVANERGVAVADGSKFCRGVLRQPVSPDGAGETPRFLTRPGFIRFAQVKGRWERKWTLDSTQPEHGFTIPAEEEEDQVELLCSLYEHGNEQSRGLIRKMAAISVEEQLQGS